MQISTIGIDIGKNSFHFVGFDARGGIVIRRQCSRTQLVRALANVPPCLVGMEACCGAHHLGRILIAQGHDVRLIPPQYVKPFVKSHKNDLLDAEAIGEAVQRPTMRFVPLKTMEQLDLQAIHRLRTRLVGRRTAVINQMRGFYSSAASHVLSDERRSLSGSPRCSTIPRWASRSASVGCSSNSATSGGSWTTTLKTSIKKSSASRVTMRPAIGSCRCLASARSRRRPSSLPSATARRLRRGAISPRGSGWCRGNIPREARPCYAASASVGMPTSGPSSFMGPAPSAVIIGRSRTAWDGGSRISRRGPIPMLSPSRSRINWCERLGPFSSETVTTTGDFSRMRDVLSPRAITP